MGGRVDGWVSGWVISRTLLPTGEWTLRPRNSSGWARGFSLQRTHSLSSDSVTHSRGPSAPESLPPSRAVGAPRAGSMCVDTPALHPPPPPPPPPPPLLLPRSATSPPPSAGYAAAAANRHQSCERGLGWGLGVGASRGQRRTCPVDVGAGVAREVRDSAVSPASEAAVDKPSSSSALRGKAGGEGGGENSRDGAGDWKRTWKRKRACGEFRGRGGKLKRVGGGVAGCWGFGARVNDEQILIEGRFEMQERKEQGIMKGNTPSSAEQMKERFPIRGLWADISNHPIVI